MVNDDLTSDPEIFTANLNRSYPFLNGIKLSELTRAKLTSNLNRIVLGSNKDYLAAIAISNPPDQLLHDFDIIYDSKRNEMHPQIIEFDLSNRLKFGSRSRAQPWINRVEGMNAYYDVSSSTDAPDISFEGSGTLRPIDVSNAAKLLKSNTNSGLPFFTKKGLVKDIVIQRFNELLADEFPCILFTRTQELGKTRNVWGYPIADTLNEMRVYSPLLGLQRLLPWRSALLGPDAVDQSVSKLMLARKGSELKFFSVDFKAYDSTVNSKLQRLAFDYIKRKFVKSSHSLIDSIFHRFNTIGIVTPDGIMHGSHGVPSGATFTNEVDSIVQWMFTQDPSVRISDELIQIQGDDGVYVVSQEQVEAISSLFARCGLKLSNDKSMLSDNSLVYLQRLYIADLMQDGFVGGVYSVYRALNRIIHQERYTDFLDYGISGVDYYSIRSISILENCKYHPLFRDLVKFVWEKDKYKLKFSGKSVHKYLDMQVSGTGTGGFLYNQFGDNIKGIFGFETYKIIKELNGS